MQDYDPRHVLRMFQGVVTQSLIDATTQLGPAPAFRMLKRGKREDDITLAARSRDSHAKRTAKHSAVRDDARNWLLNDSEDFQFICSLAGYSPDDIRERAERLADRGWTAPRARLAA